MTLNPSGLRVDYDLEKLEESEAADDPFAQFELWFADARAADLLEPNAMALATADAGGRPSVRMVLLKGFDQRGFAFFTNYESRKAVELRENARASLLFWWDRLHRQVRIEGRVEKVDAAESDAYFDERPRGSRIGAWASPQSRALPGRAELERLEAEARSRFAEDAPIPRPPHWGGYRIAPERFEFWQGRRSRLHDRLCYRHDGERWSRVRLAP
jgi:pyridoxamine 5'-phosphate oxidase